jgi:hypothetical protein
MAEIIAHHKHKGECCVYCSYGTILVQGSSAEGGCYVVLFGIDNKSP